MKMYRKRFIPNEIVDISSDEVVLDNDEMLITKWLPIHPRGDIASGMSFVFKNDGIKVSKFMGNNGEFLYWYCDIIRCERDGDDYTFTDLLVDVVVQSDSKYKVLDLDELVQAYREDLIDINMLCEALEKTSKLLKEIDKGNFPFEICNEY